VSEIVPFGKYKGQPIEVMIADDPYVKWLLAQPWLKDRYGALHLTLLSVHEPQDTPVHNLMQARLSGRFGGRLLRYLLDRALEGGLDRVARLKVFFEEGGWDVLFRLHASSKASPNDEGYVGIYVECKPTIGDDYPSVVRQVRKYKVDAGSSLRVILTDEFNASVPLKTVRRMFPDLWWVLSSDVEEYTRLRSEEGTDARVNG